MKAAATASIPMTLNSSAKASEINDATLKLCQQGDQRAFEEVFNVHKDFVFRLAYRMTGHQQTAEDITQEVFIKVYNSIGTFEFGSRFTTWLYRIALKECLERKRRKERRQRLGFDGIFETQVSRNEPSNAEEPPNVSDEVSPHKTVIQTEMESLVQIALLAVPLKMRIPIIMKDLEGLPYSEICSVLGCSIGTVSSRLNRGRKALRKALERLGMKKDYLREA